MRTGISLLLTWALLGASTALGQLDAVTREQHFVPQRESSAHPDLSRNGDSRPIEPGETLVLGDLEGPGVITHIWCTVGSADPFHGRALVLRIYWDDEDQPSVEAPLGDFFGVGHGAMKTYTSLPVSVSSEGRARTCYWRMPFHDRARVTVTNESTEYRTDSFYYYLTWEQRDTLPDDTLYFHARYRQETPARPGDYLILDTKGRGHYVGTVYSVHQMEVGWFGEGDDRFYVDGEAYPSLSGTGTEDYFNDAWGFREFHTPYYGVTLFEGYFPGDRVTAYRWHLPDPAPFTESLRVQMEHHGSVFTSTAEHLGQFIEREDWISSVAFWYQDPPATFSEPIAPLAERLPPYRVYPASGLEWRTAPEGVAAAEGFAVTMLGGGPDAAIEFSFETDEPGTYQLMALLHYNFAGGIFQPKLNGAPLGGAIDFWAMGDDPGWVHFDLHELAPGTHTLRFEGRGYSPHRRTLIAPERAPANFFRLNYLVLLRLEDMEGYQAALKRTLEGRQAP